MRGVQQGCLTALVLTAVFLLTVATSEKAELAAGKDTDTSPKTGDVLEDLSTKIPPANISGTFKGEWRDDGDVTQQFLQRDNGLVVFRLTTTLSARRGMLAVKGDLVLRDGLYVTENDVAMKLQGMYVEEVGRLTAVLEPVSSVHGSLDRGEARLRDPDYRSAVRAAAMNIRGNMLGDTAWSEVKEGLSKKCQFSLGVVFLTKSNPGGDPAADLIVNGTLTSSNCGIALALDASSAHVERYYAKAVRYTLMIIAIALVQIALTVGQMEAGSTQALASRVSLLCVGQQAVLDAYLCLLHLTLGILVEPLFNAFATAAFVQFVVFGIFEMRLLLVAWRARRGASLDPWTAQRELSTLYARFYGALLAGILLTYQLQRHAKLVTLLLHSFWIPQIVLCVKDDCRQPLKPTYVIGTSLARLALPLYIYGCPHNLLRIPPSPWTCVGLVVFMGLQVLVLIVQHSKGPRCFIPKRFLPPKYDYFRPIPGPTTKPHPADLESGKAGEDDRDCVICMNPIEPDAGRHMVAPCNHIFHQACLERWLEVKLECPTCRRQLPPP